MLLRLWLLRLSPPTLLLRLTFLLSTNHLHYAIHSYNNLGGVFLLAGLIGPFAGSQLAFDIYLRAFAEVFTGHLCQLAEEYDAMPFNRLALLTGSLIIP